MSFSAFKDNPSLITNLMLIDTTTTSMDTAPQRKMMTFIDLFLLLMFPLIVVASSSSGGFSSDGASYHTGRLSSPVASNNSSSSSSSTTLPQQRKLQEPEDKCNNDDDTTTTALYFFTSYVTISEIYYHRTADNSIDHDDENSTTHLLMTEQLRSLFVDTYNKNIHHSNCPQGNNDTDSRVQIVATEILPQPTIIRDEKEDEDNMMMMIELFLQVNATYRDYDDAYSTNTNTTAIKSPSSIFHLFDYQEELYDDNDGVTSSSSCFCEPPSIDMFVNSFRATLLQQQQQGLLLLQGEEEESQEEATNFTSLAITELSASYCDDGSSVNSASSGMTTTTVEEIAISEIILIDLVVDNCSLIDSDTSYLAQEFVQIYNNLNQDANYCDPYVRHMDTARVIRRGERRLDGDSAAVLITIELQIHGTCIGCDPNIDGFYGLPVNATNNNARGRRALLLPKLGDEKDEKAPAAIPTSFRRFPRSLLQQHNNLCLCPANSIAGRAPSESEVLDAFRSFVETVQQASLTCVTSIGQCQFGTTFESTLLVAFGGDEESLNVLESANDIESAMQDTLNRLFEQRVGICRPDFRVVKSVTAIIGIELTDDDHGQDGGSGVRRMLQTDSPFKFTEIPTSSPTTAFAAPAPTVTTTSSPTSSPTHVFGPNSLLVLLHVTGVCNGCTSALILNDQIRDGSRRLDENMMGDRSFFSFQRSLQMDMSPDSNCFCPIESIIETTGPSVNTVLDEYHNELEDSNVSLDLKTLKEVQVLDCEDEVEAFETELVLNFFIRQDTNDVESELAKLFDLIGETYNKMTNDRFCDPLIRRIGGLSLSSMTLLETGFEDCDQFSFTIEVSGTCHGCSTGSSIFHVGDNDDERRRTLFSFGDYAGDMTRNRRRLDGSELCFCARDVEANRAPNLSEFESILGDEIEKEGFDTICGVSMATNMPTNMPSETPSGSPSACSADLGKEFATELILYVEGGDTMDVETITLLGGAIETAYNDLVDLQYSECDPLYRLVTAANGIEGEDLRRGRIRGQRDEGRRAARNLFQDDQLGFPLRFFVTGRCDLCGFDSNILDTLTNEEVLSGVRHVAAMFMRADLLLAIFEIENVACSDNLIQFEEVVIVEFVPTCFEGDNFVIDDIQSSDIEETFVATYNNLASQYCDLHFTRLVSAELGNVGAITDLGNVPIEIRVFAECLGCDPQQIGIYGNPSTVERRILTMEENTQNQEPSHPPDGRFLQENEKCLCNAQAEAERPPSESEFVGAFRQRIEDLPLDCVGSVGDCQFGSAFNTDIVLSFEGNQTALTEEAQRTMKQRS